MSLNLSQFPKLQQRSELTTLNFSLSDLEILHVL